MPPRYRRDLKVLSCGRRIDVGRETAVQLAAALPCLQQLTGLQLHTVLPAFPAAVTSLGRLQRCGFTGVNPLATAALPPGPWLASLRSLAMPGDAALPSLEVLAQAPQLAKLVLGGLHSMEPASLAALVRRLARLPALREARLNRKGGTWPAEAVLALMDVHAERPALRIELQNDYVLCVPLPVS